MCKDCVLIKKKIILRSMSETGQVTWHFNGYIRSSEHFYVAGAGREWRLLLQPGDVKVDALYGAAVLSRYAATAAEVAVPTTSISIRLYFQRAAHLHFI